MTCYVALLLGSPQNGQTALHLFQKTFTVVYTYTLVTLDVAEMVMKHMVVHAGCLPSIKVASSSLHQQLVRNVVTTVQIMVTLYTVCINTKIDSEKQAAIK
jgi:hypothetical protein